MVVRREQSARSREHKGVLTRVIYECENLEILRTELEAGSACDNLESEEFATVHFVVDGTPTFRASDRTADLIPGDCIVFAREKTYTISSTAPSRSVILSVLFKDCAKDGNT